MRRMRLAGGLVALSVGLVGLLHLPMARPLMARLGVPCPVDRVSPADVANMRRSALRNLRGTAAAPSRTVFGLRMQDSREADVRAWVASRAITCQETARGMRYLTCTDVPGSVFPGDAPVAAVHDLTFLFDDRGALIGIDALRRGLTGAGAAAVASTISTRLNADLGAPTTRVGDFDAKYLDGDAFRTSVVNYRFADYLASLAAVNIPGSGVVVREQHIGGPFD